MPSHLETARNGLKARSVRIDLNTGISFKPDQTATKFISDSYTYSIKFNIKCITGNKPDMTVCLFSLLVKLLSGY